MRCLIWIQLLLAVPCWADEAKSPFRGPMREAADEDGTVSITIPKRWVDTEKGGGMLVRVRGAGGHDISVTREGDQADLDGLRKRYIEHDSAIYPGSTIKLISEPYFGYRLDMKEKNRVVVRAFATQGNDGIIFTSTSRFQNYDRIYAPQIAWVAASLTVDGARTGTTGGGGGTTGRPTRFFDDAGEVSLIAPAGWQPNALVGDEVLLIARGKRSRSTRFLIHKWPNAGSGSLAIAQVAREWKQSYGAARMERLQGKPPRLLVRGREGDWVDYFIGLFDGESGYTLRVTVRESNYEKARGMADEMAKTVAFSNSPWKTPTPPDLDLKLEYKKRAVIHAPAELAGQREKLGAELDLFLKSWARLGLGYDRKGEPIHIAITNAKEFGERSNRFGAAPAAYDRQNRVVVAVGTPSDEAEQATWRGAVHAAFAEALLHRDLKVGVPAWFRIGLTQCYRAPYAEGKVPDGAATDLLKQLKESKPQPLGELLGWSEGDFRKDPTRAAQAWGYTHLMLFGKGKLPGFYKKWRKALLKSRNKAPALSTPKYTTAPADLQAHLDKAFG
ncbi:MAG: hypothetical protein AAGD14_16720 [Planctomycetota bacterium]